MDYRNLGRSGLKISPICLGTMMFGGATPETEALRITQAARDAGVNFIDTADIYNAGRSEEVTGKVIRGGRSWWVLATKGYYPMGEGPNSRGLSRRWLFEAVEGSLRRLATDNIDIYYLHTEDRTTPLSETVAAIGDLISQGKIRYFGVSNHKAWRIMEICRICDRQGVPLPVVTQPIYNMLNRTAEVEHLPAARYGGLGVAAYSPLARGVLTGKYATGADVPAESRAGRKDKRMMETEWRDESLKIATLVSSEAAARGITPGQFAIGWVLNNSLITCAVAGPRTFEQWQNYEHALNYHFTAEDEAFADRLVAAGHTSTPGYNDPAYPVEGRVPYTAGNVSR